MEGRGSRTWVFERLPGEIREPRTPFYLCPTRPRWCSQTRRKNTDTGTEDFFRLDQESDILYCTVPRGEEGPDSLLRGWGSL